MLKMARNAITGDTKLIAVTQLTSSSNEMVQNEQNIKLSIDESALSLAKLSKVAGLDGVVCSALDSLNIKNHCGEEFLTISPGIRRACDSVGDQNRIVTPSDANKNLCNYIVVGRPITQSDDPYTSYNDILKEFRGEL